MRLGDNGCSPSTNDIVKVTVGRQPKPYERGKVSRRIKVEHSLSSSLPRPQNERTSTEEPNTHDTHVVFTPQSPEDRETQFSPFGGQKRKARPLIAASVLPLYGSFHGAIYRPSVSSLHTICRPESVGVSDWNETRVQIFRGMVGSLMRMDGIIMF
jgi:hypothetical protein